MKNLRMMMGVAIALSSGCTGGARLADSPAMEGTVHLHGAYMPSMSAARQLIVARCRGRYVAQEAPDALVFRCEQRGELVTRTTDAPAREQSL